MSVYAHPLTKYSAYTAQEYRKAVNAAVFASDNTAFGGFQGIRAGSPSPLCTISGLTVHVKAHAGYLAPWASEGVYTYAVTDTVSVQIPDATGSYKIAMVLDDPSAGHGSTPQLTCVVVDGSKADDDIAGLVIANVKAGVVSDAAPIIAPQALLIARDKTQLDGIAACDGQQAHLTNGDEYRYNLKKKSWEPLFGDATINAGLRGIFGVQDTLHYHIEGKLLTLTGSLKIVGSWNPAAGDRVLVDFPVTFVGYNKQFTYATNGKRTNWTGNNGNYLTLNGDGKIADWTNGTYIYAGSTWIVNR